ncbi:MULTISPECIES: hypothetical protein [unclassified Streptomyces]|uniref:hypothetical protein n=1 Tax=unclassified Streptomyces TaxID=2593676 RepID=UPI00068CF1D1|nr:MULTISPECIES: hypothetical protein [unclassified Streptomyces]
MHDHEVTDTGEDAELRVLVQRVVPHLEAPADRMWQVRRRVRRRRRLRAAAAGALAAAGLGLWLGTGSPGARPDTAPPAATAPAEADGHLQRFATVAGLTLEVPAGWQALAVPRGEDGAVVYAAAQHLGTDRVAGGCGEETTGAADTFACAPLSALERGGVLVAFEALDGTTPTAPPASRHASAHTPGAACRSLGGRLQYAARPLWKPGRDRPALQVSMCLGEPPAEPAGRDDSGPTPSYTVDPHHDGERAFDIEAVPDGSGAAWNGVLAQVEALIGSARHN